MADYEEIQRQLERARSDLRHLELQRSKFAGFEPPHLFHDIEDAEATIAELEAQLAAWPRDEAGQPLPTDRDFAEVEALYRQLVVERYGSLEFQGLERDTFLQDIPLEEVFVKLNLTVERVVRRPVERPAEETPQEAPQVERPTEKAPQKAPRKRFRLFRHRGEAERRREAERERRVKGEEEGTVERVQEPIPLGKALAEHPSLLISGEPGAGKTTLLRWLAVTFARNVQGQLDRLGAEFAQPRLPIVVELGRFADLFMKDKARRAPPDLETIIAETLRGEFPDLPTEFLANALAQGRCLVLCDGFDEIADSDARRRAVRSLDTFASRHKSAGNRLVIGSRPYGHREVQTGFPFCTIQPFTPEDVQRFIQHWYDLDTTLTPQERREAAKTLFDKIQAEPLILKMAQTPLLSTIIILVYRKRGDLPQRRVELYEHCVRILLKRWEDNKDIVESGVIGRATWRTQLRLLEAVAYHIHSVEQRTEARGEELLPVLSEALVNEGLCKADKALLEAEQFLAALGRRPALFQHLGDEVYAFPHLTFQEYLAARHIAAQPYPDYIDMFMPHLHEAWWQEVHLLTISHLGSGRDEEKVKKVSALLEAILDRYRPPLRFLRAIPYASPPLLPSLPSSVGEVVELVGCVVGLIAAIPYDAVEMLMQSPAYLFPRWQLTRRLAWALQRERLFAATALAGCEPESVAECTRHRVRAGLEEILLGSIANARRASSEEDALLLAAIAAGLMQFGQAGPRVTRALVKAVLEPSVGGRETLISIAGQLIRPTPKIIADLTAALHDTAWPVRQAAASVLGESQQARPEVIDSLIALLDDWSEEVRRSAAASLGQLGQPSPQVIAALLRAVGRGRDSLGEAGTSSLAQLLQSDQMSPQIVSTLLDILGDVNENYWARKAIASSLGQMGHTTPEIVAALVNVLRDEYWTIRQAAACSLGQLDHTSPELIEALVAALSDKSGTDWDDSPRKHPVAESAASSLVHLGQANPDVVHALKAALLSDTYMDPDAEVAALAILRQLGHATPEFASAFLLSDTWRHPDTKEAALAILGQSGHVAPEVVNALLTALGDDFVSKPAMSCLVQLHRANPKTSAVLLAVLRDDLNPLGAAAAFGLGLLGQVSPAVVDALIEALSSGDERVRGAAAYSLGRLGQARTEVVTTLVATLGDSKRDVRSAASSSLVQLGKASLEVVPSLIIGLSDDNAHVRDYAAEVLGRVGQTTREVIAALVTVLDDSDGNVRVSAALSLILLDQVRRKVISTLVSALGDEDEEVRYRAAWVLGQLGKTNPTVSTALESAIDDESPAVRRRAVDSLRKLGHASPKVVAAVAHELGDENWARQRQAAETLGELRCTGAEAVAALVEALTDVLEDYLTEHGRSWDYHVCQAVTGSLGQLGRTHPDAIPPLLTALEHGAWTWVREAAASSLGQLRKAPPEVISALVTAFRDPEWRVGKAAASSLAQLARDNPEVIEALLTALRDDNRYVQILAAESLGQLEQVGQEVINSLIDALKDHRIGRAASSLAQLGRANHEVVAALIATLDDIDAGMRQESASILGQSGQASAEVIAALVASLSDTSWKVGETAASSLAQLGQTNSEAADALITSLGDGRERVRRRAAAGLDQLGQSLPEAVIPGLVTALSDTDRSHTHLIYTLRVMLGYDESRRTRQAAATRLGQLGQASPEVIAALLAAVSDAEVGVREAAVISLGGLRQATRDVISALIAAQSDRHQRVRQAAVSSLIQLGQVTPEVLVALNRDLHRFYPKTRNAAHATLSRLLEGKPIPGDEWVPLKLRRERQERRRRRV